jgi:arylsulfatase A-like enzyme
MKSRNWDGGVRVPMIARWPGRIPAGQTIAEPCGTIDVLPTIVAAAGVAQPKDRTIDGRDILPVLAEKAKTPHEALLAMGGDRVMTIRSGKWKLHLHNPGASQLFAGQTDWIDPRAPDGVTILAPYEQYGPDAPPGLITGDEPAPTMLFDLETDRAEQHNLAERNPEVVARLRTLAEQMTKQP